MSFDKLLNKTCTIQTKTETQSATGSVSSTWGDTYTSIPVRYNRTREGRVIAGSYEVTVKDYTFYFKSSQTIGESDRIVVDGKTFEVVHVYSDSSVHHLEVFARETTFN